MFDGFKDVLTVEEACRALGMGKNTVYNLLKQNIIKSIRINRKYYIPKIFLIDFIDTYK